MNLFEQVFESILEARSIERMPDDYMGEDGFLHCGKCGEAKEAALPDELKIMFPNKKTRPRMCRCDRERADTEEKAEREQQAKNRIDALRGEGLYSELYKKCRFENDDRRDERGSRIAMNYAAHFDEYAQGEAGLMFWGNVGTGKSFLAACIANALIDRYYTVIMAPLQTLVADMTENFNENRDAILARVGNADLLIIDDLGVERNTEYMMEHVYDLINARYLAKKPIIVTTNLSPTQMKEDKDIRKVRVYDRLDEMCQPVKIGGESRRKNIGREKAELFRRILAAGE